jgi:hypothetical protein
MLADFWADLLIWLTPEVRVPTANTFIMFMIFYFHDRFMFFRSMSFLFLPSALGAWVSGLFVFLTNMHFTSLFIVFFWWLFEQMWFQKGYYAPPPRPLMNFKNRNKES